MGAPGAATAPTPESSGGESAPLPGEEGEPFDDADDEAGGDGQSGEAPPAVGAMATHHDASAEPAHSTAPATPSPAPAGDTLPEQRSAPPPGPGNGDTDPQ